MTLALPSSPHWAPTTTVTGMGTLPGLDDGTCAESTCAPVRSPGVTAVMRRLEWSKMDEAARAALCARGLADIFDPALRRSIAALIEDVRDRGDAAVCDALARFDGIDVAPDDLR